MKVDFIICTNSDLWYSECVKYIENLIIPDNVEIGVIGITDASSMAEGYELGRSSSEADYKVYLHQDTFIINRHFIEDIDTVFRSDDRIGVIGMLGNDDVAEQKFSWGSWRWGKVISCTGIKQLLLNRTEVTEKYRAVDCLDGMILVAKYDIPWRKDILTGWHFYDKSICLEYKRKGYLCVVPRQESPWCIHACGASELNGWNDCLPVYLNEYQDFFQIDKVLEDMELPDQNEIQRSSLMADKVESLINNGEMDAAICLMDEIHRGGAKLNKRLVFFGNLLEIWETGECNLFFQSGDSVTEMWLKYNQAFFLLQRKRYGLSLNEQETMFLSELTEQERSVVLRHELTLHDQVKKNASEVLGVLEQVTQKGKNLLEKLKGGNADAEEVAANVVVLAAMIDVVECMVPVSIYRQYREFFTAFSIFCRQCGNAGFLVANVEDLASSLELFGECMDALKNHFVMRIKKCPCCGHKVMYNPLPAYYNAMEVRYHVTTKSKSETLNEEEYLCPDCGASDRDRMIISFLKKERLRDAAEGAKVLQIAPAASISRWILRYCPQIEYETTDLFMEGVTFRSDLQDMNMVQDETYDVVICSHVLEHVQDDRKALGEIKRVLKPNGKLIFLVPINLNREDIDEEWGLSEAENWRRFGQGDHCRSYGKKGLLDRLREQFYVHSLGKEYFGSEIFSQCALTDTSVLYILTKEEKVPLDMAEEIIVDETLCKKGPLVSVIMSCYNHESFVAQAIESVINQSYKNIEFIVADDASPDNTAAVMKRYSSYFTKEMYFEENIGGRSEFLQQYATGKYIALMHSDDVWEKDKLALQVAYMEEHEECGACLTWCVYTDEELRERDDSTFLRRNRNSSEWMRFFWEHGNALCNPSSLIRREIGMEVRKNPCSQLPDFFKWVDVVQRTSIYVIPKVLVRMRRYHVSGRENTSICSPENLMRHKAEEGCNWLWVIRDMSVDFFKQAFGEMMIDPLASTEQEIKCEKYFLMLRHTNHFVQYSAMCYFCEIFNEVKECIEEKYHYSYKELKEDIMNKGVVSDYQIKG